MKRFERALRVAAGACLYLGILLPVVTEKHQVVWWVQCLVGLGLGAGGSYAIDSVAGDVKLGSSLSVPSRIRAKVRRLLRNCLIDAVILLGLRAATGVVPIQVLGEFGLSFAFFTTLFTFTWRL